MAPKKSTVTKKKVVEPPDPKLAEFAHELINIASQKYGFRYEAIAAVREILPGYQPEHEAAQYAEAYASQLNTTDEIKAVAREAFLAGYDEAS